MTQPTTTPLRAAMAHARRVNELSPHPDPATLHSPAFAELSYLGSEMEVPAPEGRRSLPSNAKVSVQ